MAEESESGDKTEDPTQRRLEQALERGYVAKSQEVNTWFVIAASTLMVYSFANSMGADIFKLCRGLIENSWKLRTDGAAFSILMRDVGMHVLAACAIPVSLLALGSIVGNLIQHRLVWSTEGLTPKFSKISPLAGLKRLFSKQALMNFVKGLLKLIVVGGALCAVLWPERERLESLMSFDPLFLLSVVRTHSLGLMGAVCAILAVVAAGDFLFQYRTWFEKQKMSLREIKDEFKETDGDPKIKAKIRQLRMQRSRKRMMQAVPEATVVITNPTHFAVALKYERGMAAPICIAKGQDNIALKIREVAGENRVPIVENPPLARVLFATVEIDQEVPAEHYKAVAEVIGYVMNLKRRFAR